MRESEGGPHSREFPGVDFRIILALSLVHFIGDFYASFINPLLPVFVDKFSLTLAQVGLITGISRILAFIVQPPVGYIADHFRTRLFILGGPLLAMIFIPLAGVAPRFAMLVLFICLGSIGTAMFHPTTAGMVPAYAGPNLGLSLSIFNMGGTLAFAVGPLFITYFVHSYDLAASPYTMLIGLAVMVLLFRTVPRPTGEGLEHLGIVASVKEAMGKVWRWLLSIWLIMVLRAFVGQSFMTFIPVLYAKEGYSLVSIGMMLSLFTLAGAMSGLVAGHLADRVGYKPIFLAAHALMVPSLLLLLLLPGTWVYPAAFSAGFFVLSTLPLGLALAQSLAPRGRAMVSSLMMGLAFGTGGMMTPLTGIMADIYSIRAVLSWLTIIPLLTMILIATIPEKK